MIHSFLKAVRLGQPLLSFLLPNRCGVCGEFDESVVCAQCIRSFSFSPLLHDDVIPNGLIQSYYLFEDVLQQALHQLKFDSNAAVADVLADRLTSDVAVPIFWDSVDYFVPVPIHWRRRWMRGYNQVELIFKAWTGDRFASHLCRRVRSTVPLFELSAAERVFALNQSFWVSDQVRGKTICLLDDILTTGATFREIATQMLNAGAQCVHGIAFSYKS